MNQRNQKSNKEPIFDDWAEYKRLVLSELERLNQAVEKLKDQAVELQTYIQSEIASAREGLNEKIAKLDKGHPTHEQVAAFKKEIDELEKRFLSFKRDQQHDSTISSKYGLWAAVISIIGSLIVSIISLIVALN
jgi:predicted  nucleic acid-binding Zn-ribbon protein